MKRSLRNFTKYLLRSGSVSLAAQASGFQRPKGVQAYRWRGYDVWHDNGFGTLMKFLLKEKREYWLPEGFDPRTIVEVGASDGISTIYLSARFPNARILAIEPQSVWQDVLHRNAESAGNVEVFLVALGDREGELELRGSSKKPTGASGFMAEHTKSGELIEKVPMRTLAGLLDDAGLDAPDVLKLDCEGAEYGILAAFPEDRLRKISWIIGELHGHHDFKVLDLLDGNGFRIDGRKTLHKPQWRFHAVREDVLEKLGTDWNVKALQW
jgi:FkbM family methyltransferase